MKSLRTEGFITTTSEALIIMSVNVRGSEKTVQSAMLHNDHKNHHTTKNNNQSQKGGSVTHKHRTEKKGNEYQTGSDDYTNEETETRDMITPVNYFIIFMSNLVVVHRSFPVIRLMNDSIPINCCQGLKHPDCATTRATRF